MIGLGDKVRDKVTGFSGIVTSVTEYLNGCNRCGVQSDNLDKESLPTNAQFFDITQLVLVESKVVAEGAKVTGGPREDARVVDPPK